MAAEKNNTLVMTATYNERENLPQLVDQVFQTAPGVDLLVIDDNSPDGTGQWCDEQTSADSRMHVLHRAGKLGLGSAIVEGMKYAIDRGYTYVVNMDADFSHHPRYLPELIAGMEGNGHSAVDVMIGSRYVPGGKIEGWPLRRYIMSRGINVYSRLLLGLKPKDCSGGYRCYRVSRLARFDFDQIQAQGYAFQEELLWRLKRQGCRIAELPITFVDRVRGTSKINSREAFHALTTIAALGRQNLLRR
jgi:dolichol-phosphate mannosyltransferase